MSLKKYATAQERKIATALVERLLGAGYQVGVHDGGEVTITATADKETVLDALATTDMDTLRVFKDGRRVGGVLLIWGNGEDLISDYTHVEELCSLLDNWEVA